MRVVLLIAPLLLALVACGDYESNVVSGNREGILHWGNAAEPAELDPHIVTGVPEHSLMAALFEGLVAKNPSTLAVEPAVATSWQVSDDGRVYRFAIRASARWSNGDAITAEDFRWSWYRALQPGLGNPYAYMFAPIVNASAFASGELTDFSQVGIKVLDRLTLQVTLANPTPFFLQLLDHYSSYPVHRATIEARGAIDERGTRWTRVEHFVGNGPFTLKEWSLNKAIVVAKSSTYWDSATVQLKQIVFHPIGNIATEERMFRAGQLHYTYDVPAAKIERYQTEQPEMLRISPYLGTYFYRINTRLPHLRDVRVRQALSLAVDRESIVNYVTRAGELAAYTLTPPGTLGYVAKAIAAYNPDRARALLAAAGYPDGAGFPVTEILYNSSEAHRKIAVAIQQMWKQALNIDVVLVNQDWKVYLAAQASGNYQLSRASWIGDYVDPNSFLDMWVEDGGNNRTGWSNKEFERLVLEVAPSAATEAARYAAFREAETILLQEAPIIVIYTYVSKHLIHPSLRGFPANIMNHPSFKHMSLHSGEPES